MWPDMLATWEDGKDIVMQSGDDGLYVSVLTARALGGRVGLGYLNPVRGWADAGISV
jgi:hypothetical protein